VEVQGGSSWVAEAERRRWAGMSWKVEMEEEEDDRWRRKVEQVDR
jgi:hypothetical protein